MNEQAQRRSFGSTVVAALVLLIVAWLLLQFVIGSPLVPVQHRSCSSLAVVAVVWALRVLL